MIVHGAEWVPTLAELLGGPIDPETMVIAELTEEGEPAAVFGFVDWIDGDIQGSLWSRPGGVSRRLLGICARYVFRQLGCDRLTIKVRADNAAMLSLAPRLGFVHEGTMRAAHHGLDVWIFGMLRHECRWLRDGEGASHEETQAATGTEPG